MKPEGKWTRTPPGGDVAFCFDRDELKVWIEQQSKLAAEAEKLGKDPPPSFTVPRVAQRFSLPDGIFWLVSGSSVLWPEKTLRKRVVWWSKPLNIPRINYVHAKEIQDGARREEDLGRAADAPRQPGADPVQDQPGGADG